MNFRKFELAGAVTTGFLKFLMVDVFSFKFVYVVGACLFWIGYIIFRRRSDPDVFRHWGFSRDHLKASFSITGVFAVCVFICLFGYGAWSGSVIWTSHMIPILLLYPIWGVIQQFLMMSLIAGNLQAMKKPDWIVILVTASMFAIVHYPSLILIGGTFFLALFYTRIFMKWPNLWALGLFHGWLGCFFFYWILNRDPWIEFIAMLN